MQEIHNRFKKIMVANRGEIAIRVLRAGHELGLTTVAMYTYEDRYSLHRYKADESYQIGSNDEPLRPYLDVEEIIRVAKANGVEAIHPGYGFLSENVTFARRCREEGIVFIGPTPETMERLGDKVAAKIVAKEVGVPMIPDSQLDLNTEGVALSEAQRIGFPLMVKAVAGGGGRGMRVVRSEADFLKSYREARGEAKTAFGNDTIFLEKFIENPKHIEVQILGDNYGNIIHLFERDCSVQRRFQKVVEIAPSLTLKEETRQKLYDYAKAICSHVNYACAGTVEFLVDADENIYFIEVNPRIQVEHTVTEEITGIDLVRSQILIAMGYSLHHKTLRIGKQEDIECSGFAIQCRITTEDPTDNFKPDYGTLIAYRSPGGFGIRLDAGSAYAGAQISPFFDSMLVKVTAWGRTFDGAAERLLRALSEFRIRGVKTNIGFMENLLHDKTFRKGQCTVNYIAEHPELLKMPRRQDRGTKMLRYLAEVIVNGNADVPFVDKKRNALFRTPHVPAFDAAKPMPKGTRDRLKELGADGFAKWLTAEKQIHYTDTTFRDAHQSLLATRVRTYDMKMIAESYAQHFGDKLFSIEMWGGATFDVAMRFLKECPWKRLDILRGLMPNVLFQMLLRGSNGVGYKAYPDNLIEKFIEDAADKGIDVFRIFDSFNNIDSMLTSIRTVRARTGSIAEACICYTSDFTNPNRPKFDLNYYIEMAKRLEGEGSHILGIKDMAGLLKPYAAATLIAELKKHISIPIHLHTHDTASIQSSTYLKAIEAGVDVIDVAMASMSGLTSQPNFNSIVAMMQGHERENVMDLHLLNKFSNYWEDVRELYYPFESELKAGTAEVYDHEIPGGQYSNLRPQARSLGLEAKFETVKQNYHIVNAMFGDIVKVTPSSKVVGDMALFMTANGLSKEDVLLRGGNLAFPESVKEMMRGDLGLNPGGFPAEIQNIILKGETPNDKQPNEYLPPIDFEKEKLFFKNKFGEYVHDLDFLSWQLYPKVFEDFNKHFEEFGAVRNIPTPAFFYGLKHNEEILIEIDKGKSILIKFLNMSEPNDAGERTVFFLLNGQTRSITVKDKKVETKIAIHKKIATKFDIGAPLQGSISRILVKEGDVIESGAPLFIIEAMKMESTITSPMAGTVKKIHLSEKTLVEQDDLIIELV
ncbi:MAG: pyruvate carboxylase [Saprospiraceae bacterium]|nr:pyruvate carboxylase [Saprospiraceae bacterium]